MFRIKCLIDADSVYSDRYYVTFLILVVEVVELRIVPVGGHDDRMNQEYGAGPVHFTGQRKTAQFMHFRVFLKTKEIQYYSIV